MEFEVHFRPGRQGRREMADGPAPEPAAGREGLPRVTRLLALAHRWNDLLERGEILNQAEIARLMGITEARVSQIMNLAYLAPAIQERVLMPDSRPALGILREERRLRTLGTAPTWAQQIEASAQRD